MKKDVWDSSVPVEKSSYLSDDEIKYFNIENFKTDNSKLKMLDLFCGAGGFSVGCSWAGFESVFGVDHFAPAMATWTANHPNAIGCLGDIKKIEPEKIHKMLREKGVEKIDLITGGVPCQGFSISNRKHNDNDERNFLFLEYMKFVKEFLPDYIILENVSGMRSTAGGHFENSIKEYMLELGYEVTVGFLNAADFGVPQLRIRLLFVGVRKGSNKTRPFVFPKPKYTFDKYRTVKDAFSDLPKLNVSEKKIEYATECQNEYQKLLRGEGELPIIKSTKLLNHSAPNHPQSTVDLINATAQGMPMYERFKQRIRLKENAPSPTQLAGGIRPSFQFGHPTEARGLSTRERARIQSFPDSYEFFGGIVQERIQTGNAVPPLLIYNVADLIAKDIRKKDDI